MCGSTRANVSPIEASSRTRSTTGIDGILGRTIRSVDVIGVPSQLRHELIRGLSLHPGEPLQAEPLRADLVSLAHLGIAESVSVAAEPIGEAVAIRYELALYVPIAQVTMRGEHHPALGELAMLEGALADMSRVNRLRDHALEQVGEAGYLDATIKVTHTRGDAGEDLCIAVALGRRYLLDRIETTGGRAVDPDVVERTLARQDRRINAVGGIYVAHRLRSALDGLKLAYLDRGYAAVRIGDPVVTIDRRRARVSIQIPIDQGEPYRLGVVTIPWSIGATLGLTSGSPLSQLSVDRARERLERWGAPRGIAIQMNAVVHESSRTVDLTFADAKASDHGP